MLQNRLFREPGRRYLVEQNRQPGYPGSVIVVRSSSSSSSLVIVLVRRRPSSVVVRHPYPPQTKGKPDGYWKLETGNWILDTWNGYCILDTGIWNLVVYRRQGGHSEKSSGKKGEDPFLRIAEERVLSFPPDSSIQGPTGLYRAIQGYIGPLQGPSGHHTALTIHLCFCTGIVNKTENEPWVRRFPLVKQQKSRKGEKRVLAVSESWILNTGY